LHIIASLLGYPNAAVVGGKGLLYRLSFARFAELATMKWLSGWRSGGS